MAAVVVLEDGATEPRRTWGGYLRDWIAAFKVPERIVIASETPKGPTGKVQQHTLAQTLGLGDAAAH